MTLAATLMIRDEADILPAWLDWHVAQGVDVFVITDNGSIDGSTEILQAFAERTDVVVDLRHDPVHRKQQGSLVTGMARDAATVHGADWVINADADEFIVPIDRSRTLGSVFAELDRAIGAFTVPVVNMVGRLAKSGTGIERLHWRDERSDEDLQAIGLLAQPTSNAVHVGDADVVVVQGNHQVSIANGAEVPERLRLEVLHLPWRSWSQYAHRVEVSGQAYDANPDMTPSPNHHGMRDYRRLRGGVLDAYFALRFVTDADAVTAPFTRDTTLADFFAAHDLHPAVTKDQLVGAADLRRLQQLGRWLVTTDDTIATTTAARDAAAEDARLLSATVRHLEDRLTETEYAFAEFRARRSVQIATRITDRLGRG